MGKDLTGKEIGRGIVQRKSGVYYGRAVVRGNKIELYNHSLSELKKELELAKAKALTEDKVEQKEYTLTEWFEEYFNSYKRPSLKTETSAAAYYRKVKNTYISILGDKKIQSVSHLDVQNATNTLLENKYTVRTIKEALGVLRGCFEVGMMNSIAKINPCININIKNENQAVPERRVLDEYELKIFLEEIKGDYYEEAYKILLSTGMRIGEFSALQWEDIDWTRKVIKIQRSMSVGYLNGKKILELVPPKTAKAYREIPFFGETEALLKSWKKKQDMYKNKLGDRWRGLPEHGDLVFTTTFGSACTRYVLVHSIEKITNNINLKEQYRAAMEGREPHHFEHIHPHAFRHTFATMCFQKKIDPFVVQNLLGHANYQQTLSYTHLLDNKKQEEINKVGNFLN